MRRMLAAGGGGTGAAKAFVSCAVCAQGEPAFFKRVDGLGNDIGLQIEQRAHVFLRQAGSSRREQFHEHAILRDIELARLFQRGVERLVGEFERHKERRIEFRAKHGSFFRCISS